MLHFTECMTSGTLLRVDPINGRWLTRYELLENRLSWNLHRFPAEGHLCSTQPLNLHVLRCSTSQQNQKCMCDEPKRATSVTLSLYGSPVTKLPTKFADDAQGISH